MNWLANWRRFLRRDDLDAEQEEELESYVELTARDYVARGMDPIEARAAAQRKLGNPTLIREEVYEMNTLVLLEGFLRDARHALRMIRRNPGFSAIAILSLALGIGANCAIFSILNAVLIRPLPYPQAGALLGVSNRLVIHGQVFENADLSAGMYAACKFNATVFENFGVWTTGAATLSGIGDPEQLATVNATQGVLPTLRVPPHLGRWFTVEDDTPESPNTVILSYGYWQRKFGGDPRIIGRTVVIDFVPREVIGVMPQDFRFVNVSPDIFLPQRFPKTIIGPEAFNYAGIGRLKPGVTIAMANQDVARVWKAWGQTAGTAKMLDALSISPNLRPLKKDVVGDVGSVLTLLMGALGLVLLLVCANVANLVLVRAQSRREEFAIRAALGAGWERIARELLVESLTLGILGGALGLLVAYAGLRMLVAGGLASLPRLTEVSIDGASLAFTFGCVIACSLLFGVAAVLRCGIPGRLQAARGATQGTEQLRAQNAFVVTQVALAFVLLVAAGLITRSFLAMRAVKPGFTHPEWIQMTRIAIPSALTPDPEQVIRMQAGIVTRISSIPGVTAVGFASGLPMETEYKNGNPIGVEGKTTGELPPNRDVRTISPGLLATQGTRLVAGRDFAWDDIFGQRRVAIVSENMARANWREPPNAVGKILLNGGNRIEVVGVAEDVHVAGANQPAPEIVYLRMGVMPPYRPGGEAIVRRGATFAIRTERAGTESFIREVSAAIHGVGPSLPLAKVRTLNDVYRQSMARTSFTLVLLGIAGSIALMLSVVGVYGVIAYAAAQRRREVSIRLALGAQPKALKWVFVRKGLVLNFAGSAAGLGLAMALSRFVTSMLFGVKPLDVPAYLAAGLLIAAAAMMASYLPAHRAASVDPMETLREE